MLLIRRTLWGVVVIWLAATLAFFALRVLPGDAITIQLMDSGADADEIARQRDALGLSDSPAVQYLRYWANLLRGDLGESLASGQPVTTLIAISLGPTLALATGALLVAVAAGLTLGLAAALDINRMLSATARLLISLTLSTPIYWSGTLAIYVFTVALAWFPSGGAGQLSQLVLPASVLGLHTAGAIARAVQREVSEARQSDFVRAARAKGLYERRIVLVHMLRAGLVPVITVVALQAGFLLSGVVITETLFARPGLGRLLLDATVRQDYPVVQGVVVLAASIYTFINTATDISYQLLDPRVRS